MLTLKKYQKRSLDILSSYLKDVRHKGASQAFESKTERPYLTIPQLPGLPYVCLRVPTGGGKTIMSSYSINIVMKELLQQENSVVLWLVPTTQIKEQTLEALRDIDHPYRKALEETITTPITVMNTTEALFLQKNTVENETLIIVSTLSALRIEDTDGRKIYDENGHLKIFFDDLNEKTRGNLETTAEGNIIYSLANVIKTKRPIVIMDEAHNARTSLSFDTLARFNPSCIIEYTATPRTTHRPENGDYASNVLWSVSAAELNAESMVKLPIRLETRTNWREVISLALGRRKRLQITANRLFSETGEYIRPIVLFQAQNNSQTRTTVNVEAILKSLIEDFKIPREEIAIAIGNQREIEGIDLFSKDCKINFIITVSALKEGWDCSFAYVLCSVAEMGSPTAVEQLVGRIMRLPNAEKKKYEELNKAYTYVSSQTFSQTLRSLTDALVDNGFERFEAETLITPPIPELDLFNPDLFVSKEVIEEVPNLSDLPEPLKEKLEYDQSEKTLKYTGLMSKEEKEEIEKCFTTDVGKQAVEDLFAQTKEIPFFEPRTISSEVNEPPLQKEDFKVPYLGYKQGDLFKIVEESLFIDNSWKIAECGYELSEEQFSVNTTAPAGQIGEVSVTDRGSVESRFIEELSEQMSLNIDNRGWTIAELANWLDRKIPHPDITYKQSSIFIYKVIQYLIEERGIDLAVLIHFKYKLREAVENLIESHRIEARKQAFQVFLELDDDTVIVRDEFAFSFDKEIYPASWYYNGRYLFNKHYHNLVGELKSEGEEYECAVKIDQIPEVKHWIRNIDSNSQYSFWLQKSKGRFYPDFIAELNDGRIAVIEYKGNPYREMAKELEKKAVGELWASRSEGKCLFIWANVDNLSNLRELLTH